MTSKKKKKSKKQEKKDESAKKYDASQIRVMKGLEAVRKRPAMYIGSTDKSGLHHIVYEAVDNSIDEAIAGYCDEILITLHKDGSLSVEDNGRGIPIDKHAVTKKSALETAMTNLHAGGKFEKGAYKVSGGLHGVGVKTTNALSEWMITQVFKDGKIYQQKYARGKAKSKLETVGQTDKTGTKHQFLPDKEIFETTKFNFNTIVKRSRQQAYLTGGVHFRLLDERGKKDKIQNLYFEGGIKSYVKALNYEQKRLTSVFYVDKTVDDVKVEVALQYTESMQERVLAFTNNIENVEGGTHLTGFKSALTKAVNNFLSSDENGKNSKDKNIQLSGDDAREGLTAVISVKVPDPQFEGQTKMKLNNPEVKGIVEKVVREGIEQFLSENPDDAKAVTEKAILAFRARSAAKAAREAVIRKSALESTSLPGTLADCSSKEPEESEIYIVEGDSAGGCFSGGTKIALTDGRNVSFRQLVKEHKKGKLNYCYTIKNNGSIGVEKIKHPRVTKRNTEVIKVTLDNEEEIVCTPDHKFMLRDGSYKQAKDLSKNDSLMPLYRKHSEIKNRITIEGYEMVFDPKSHHWIFTHKLSDNFNLENEYYNEDYGSHKHHKDFNKLNNTIKFMKKVLDETGNLDSYDAKRRELGNRNLLKKETFVERFFENSEEDAVEAVKKHNHKVIKIEKLEKRIDVYDIEVPETHNFALASGVFVHNSAKQGRDRHTQAVLPLCGKPINSEKYRIDRVLKNDRFIEMVTALGCGIGETFDPSKLRYHKVILMNDADVDGSHITTLVLTFIYRHMPELIQQGYVYVAQSPLFRAKVGKEKYYFLNEAEKEQFVKELQKTGKKVPDISRFKGLGEMNPEELWETTMNPETRVLKKITIEDAEEADRVFDMLMGSEVPPRRRFIQTYALDANLDV